MTRIDPDSEQALEHATLKLFQQLGWDTVDCYDEVFGDVPASKGKLSNHLALWANYLLSLPLIMR